MKRLVFFTALFCLYACQDLADNGGSPSEDDVELYDTFNSANHITITIDKKRFDTLHGWDLGWALLEPFSKVNDQGEAEIAMAKQFSPGQKALHFFWYLDEEVTNGGFIQFYWNGYGKYIPPIRLGLRLLHDTAMLRLVDKADNEFMLNREKFDLQAPMEKLPPLYDSLKVFKTYDERFLQIRDRTMELLEMYVRKHPEEFVDFKPAIKK